MILLPIFLLGLSEAFWLTNNYDRDNSALSKKASILPDSSTSVLNDYGLVARKVLELWKKIWNFRNDLFSWAPSADMDYTAYLPG